MHRKKQSESTGQPPAGGAIAAHLRPFFEPQGIVIVGASRHPAKLGFALARNLLQSGYRGAVHFVNPGGGTLLGNPLYPAVADVPDPVDLAVLLVAAPQVPGVLAECGRRGIRAAIIASGGFRETGPAGAALEEASLAVAAECGMRLMGPNCIGILDTHYPFDVTFLPPPGPVQGDIAFISHSGAICAAVIDWAGGQGFGLSLLVSVGNQADLQETDFLAPVAAHPETRVLTMYLEGLTEGRRFVAEAARVTRELPIVALKVGRGESGRKAVASHTGALAGQESAYDAAFRRAGVIRADTSEALFDWARALAWCPPPAGRGVAVLTNAGGPGITAVDALEFNGLQLAQLGDKTQAELRAILPPAASVANPVDMLASASPTQYADCLQLLLVDESVHSVLVILPPPPVFSTAGVARAMIPIIYTATKPVVVSLMGERMIQEAVEHFRAAHVPDYRFPERAAAALGVLADRSDFLATPVSEPVVVSDVDRPAAAAALAAVEGDGLLPEWATRKLLTAYGLPGVPAALAQGADEAAALAEAMGYPVALKIMSPDIAHKSDVGGVSLSLTTADAVRAEFGALRARVTAARPAAVIEGVLVQRMVPAGQEVIVGVVRDPQFGPLLMFGGGGVEVEAQRDVAFALAPATAEEVEQMLARTWAGRRLAGYRGLAAADRGAVEDVLYRVGQLAADFPELSEIEINPLVVLADGALAVDARVFRAR